MNTDITILALIEIVGSLTTGLLIMAITYKIVKRVGLKLYNIKPNNLSFSILIASVLFSVGYMVTAVIQPTLSSFKMLGRASHGTFDMLLPFLGYSSLYVAIAFVSSLLITLSGIYIYRILTPIDEFEEIKNNNTGVALIVGSIIIVLTLMSKDGVTLLIESIVPYPDLPPF